MNNESLIIYEDAIRLISDFRPTGESDKVRTYKFTEIESISFKRKEKSKLLKFKLIKHLVTFISIIFGAGITGHDLKPLEINILLSTGKKITHKFLYSKDDDADKKESLLKKLLQESRTN